MYKSNQHLNMDHDIEDAKGRSKARDDALSVLRSRAPTEGYVDPVHIAKALRLTETEARLAATLTVGKTIKEFAQTQGCTWHTARTHVRNLLAKTGCHRQAELVHLVHALIAQPASAPGTPW